jgi:hypothetical protein
MGENHGERKMTTDSDEKERWYCVSRQGMATLCLSEEEARQLAEESNVDFPRCSPHRAVRLIDAAEVEALRAEVAELDALRDTLSDLLKRTAIALRGPEPPLTAWSWHDLPERAAAAIAAIEVMQLAAFKAAALEPKP